MSPFLKIKEWFQVRESDTEFGERLPWKCFIFLMAAVIAVGTVVTFGVEVNRSLDVASKIRIRKAEAAEAAKVALEKEQHLALMREKRKLEMLNKKGIIPTRSSK